jgi:hypothetical protein
MTLDDLKLILANRLSTLGQQRSHAVIIGDLGRVNELDAEITDTELTVAQLDTL